jgi:hypothetical protein
VHVARLRETSSLQSRRDTIAMEVKPRHPPGRRTADLPSCQAAGVGRRWSRYAQGELEDQPKGSPPLPEAESPEHPLRCKDFGYRRWLWAEHEITFSRDR